MPKNQYLKCRVTAEEKTQFTQKATAIGATESDLVRALLFSDDKLIVLGGGCEIAARLYALNTRFEAARQAGSLSAEDTAGLRKELGRIAAQLCEIEQYTADLSSKDEEDEDERSDDDQ